MKARTTFWFCVAALVVGSVAFGEAQVQQPTRNPDWRPTGIKMFRKLIEDRYDIEQILDLHPENFNLNEIARYRALTRAGNYRDVNEEFECKYTLFRYALAYWTTSTDNPYIQKEFEDRYLSFQDLCRKLASQHAFANREQEEKADWVKDPFRIYRYSLQICMEDLAIQLETRDNPHEPYTTAEQYIAYPSEANEKKLQNLFVTTNPFYLNKYYTWERYFYRFQFQAARQRLYAAEWERELKRYEDLLRRKEDSDGYREMLEAARRTADFAFQRLKKEGETNCLPYFSQEDALCLSHSTDDYLLKVDEEKRLAESRRASGKTKEVVVFVHGLGETRAFWGLFPELLAREDVADPSLKKYYRVYVFQYATKENSWGVDDFKADLVRFIDRIKETEGVQKVTLIAHSYGGVLSLRYLIGSDPATHKPYRDNVERFIGFAPSLHGSLVANTVVDLFGKRERKFQRELPPLFYQMPFTAGMGDLQIRQNEVGSEVNLTSFAAFDKERSLEGIPVLTVIGDPFKLFGFLSPGGSPEDDSLVKTYSANLNHRFLTGPSAGKDAGYSAAEVRYMNCDHYATIKAMNREHQGYQYATSFLRGQLLPQAYPGLFQVKYFLAAVRVAPAGAANAGKFFLQRPQLSPVGELILPEIEIKPVGPKGTEIHKADWNPASSVYFVEGNVFSGFHEGSLKLLLSAKGYESKEVDLPVAGGRTTYAIELTLEQR